MHWFLISTKPATQKEDEDKCSHKNTDINEGD
jgi:hypothetical protein